MLAGLIVGLSLVAPPSAYAGQEQRPLKALSAEEVRGYLDGAGMGLAKAAELNHYPGPRHVLDLAAELELSPAQRAGVQAAFERMQASARELGAQLVAEERALDQAFALGTITSAELDRRLDGLGALHGRLRATHLRAHLETRALLTPAQVKRYDELRGYAEAQPHDPPHPH